jgi:hypothetical protein
MVLAMKSPVLPSPSSSRSFRGVVRGSVNTVSRRTHIRDGAGLIAAKHVHVRSSRREQAAAGGYYLLELGDAGGE